MKKIKGLGDTFQFLQFLQVIVPLIISKKKKSKSK